MVIKVANYLCSYNIKGKEKKGKFDEIGKGKEKKEKKMREGKRKKGKKGIKKHELEGKGREASTIKFFTCLERWNCLQLLSCSKVSAST